jgi:dihydrodipicolinate synthase/N-acetylneuraminate lyase
MIERVTEKMERAVTPRNLFSFAAAARRRGKRVARYQPPAGLSVPIVTVLDRAGQVLEDDQRALVRYAIQDGAGADIIFAAGTTGEWNRMDNARRQLVSRIAVDECRNALRSGRRVEGWVGITGNTRAETIENLEHAIEISADAAVVAPLSITDVEDPVDFITSEIGGVFERLRKRLPIFLYDNEDIAAAGKAPHLHTRDVKLMSRLNYVSGIKVTAGKAVLGNYTQAASHFKRKGEFAIYPGNAYLIFDLFMPSEGLVRRLRNTWNQFLTNNSLPHGVVAGAANVMPREWQRAWQVCRAGEASMIDRYRIAMEEFREATEFVRGAKTYRPTIACIKAALCHLGVISNDAVAAGTPDLDANQRREYLRRFNEVRRRACVMLEPEWQSHWMKRRQLSARELQQA